MKSLANFGAKVTDVKTQHERADNAQ